MKLSIIIPMYKVERYIKKCLLSCLNQDIPVDDYEIIVVNDGSPDDSLAIADHVASTTMNITLISQDNGGLSVARNKGLSLAKGEYVWFVDSDDWIEDNCLGGILKCLDDTTPDFLQLQYRLSYDDDSLNKNCYCRINGVIDGIQQIANGGVPIPAQFVVYRREFLEKNRLTFYPGIYHEDCEFKPRALFLAERCTSYDKVVYNYYQRTSGSITTVANPKRAFDLLKVAYSIDTFYTEVAKGRCSLFFHNHISLMINNALSVVGEKNRAFSSLLYKEKRLFVHLRKSSILKYKVEGWLFTLFPNRSVSIYNLLRKIS